MSSPELIILAQGLPEALGRIQRGYQQTDLQSATAKPDKKAARANIPQWPMLGEFLSRAETGFSPHDHFAALSFELFRHEPTTPLPVAALTRLHDQAIKTDADGIWMRADPVNLRADLSRVFLLQQSGLAISDAERNQLEQDLRVWFTEVGYGFEAPANERWYLRLAARESFSLPSPDRSLGCDLSELIPGNAEYSHWRGLFNETQMFLHQHPVNESRRQQGWPEINSLWFWGPGELPAQSGEGFAHIDGDEALLLGLQRHAGECQNGRRLYHWTPLRAASDEASLAMLEAQLTQAMGEINNTMLQSLCLQLEDGRRWRLRKPASGLLQRSRRSVARFLRRQPSVYEEITQP